MNRRAVTLRSRAELPDWSAVRSDIARRALEASFDAFDMGRKWAGLDAAEDRIWRAILIAYVEVETAPSVTELAAETHLSPHKVEDVLRRLRRRDLVVLAPDGRIVGAYPFTDRVTEHHVHFGDRSVTAMCAIDALGIGAMLGADTRIRSSCRHCGAPIEIATCEKGGRLGRITPDTAVVWSGLRYADSCAATSLCMVQAFFCSDEHLTSWREDGAGGFRLSVDDAFQVGKAIFSPILQPAA